MKLSSKKSFNSAVRPKATVTKTNQVSNKSIEKYINEKFKEIETENNLKTLKTDADGNGNGINNINSHNHNNHNNNLNNFNANAQLIKNSSPDLRSSFTKSKGNSSFCDNKTLKMYIETKFNKINANDHKAEKLINTNESLPTSPNTNLHNNFFNKSCVSNECNSLSTENAFIVEDDSPVLKNNNNINKFASIKKSLIELVNETKDKGTILRELDNIYKNILRVSNPLNPNTQTEEDCNANLNFTRCNSAFVVNDPHLNSNYFNNISHVSHVNTSSASKPSFNNANANEDENEFLRKENLTLKKKFDDYDKKIERIVKENEELKGFVKKKSENIKTLEDVIKGFQGEMEDVKKKLELNTFLIKSNLIKSENSGNKKEKLSTNTYNNSHNTLNNSYNNSYNNNSHNTLNSNCNTFNKKLKLNSHLNNRSNSISGFNVVNSINSSINVMPNLKDTFNAYKNIDTYIQEESNLQTTMSIESLQEEEAKKIYYYPTKVNSEILPKKNIPKIRIQNFAEEKFEDSIESQNKIKNLSVKDEEEDDIIYILSDDDSQHM